MNKNTTEPTLGSSEMEDVINVRAIISCPSGDYRKKFKNRFPRKDLEAVNCIPWILPVSRGI